MINKVQENNISSGSLFGYLARKSSPKIQTRPYEYMHFMKNTKKNNDTGFNILWKKLKEICKF